MTSSTRRRRQIQIRIQQTIILISITGSLAAILSANDSWFPFSNYPMYARTFVPNPNARFFSVQIVDAKNNEKYLETRNFLKPFWLASYREALLFDPEESRVREKLKATLEWYDRSRKNAGETEGTAKMRLYVHFLPWDQLVETEMKQLDRWKMFDNHRQLLLEVEP